MSKLHLAMVAASLIQLSACADIDTDSTEQGSPSEDAESLTLDTQASSEIHNASFSSCPTGHICFFTGANGSGSMCSWGASDDDRDWASGAIVCSWALTHNVCSVFNRTSRNIEYFKAADWANRVGSTNPSVAGNLACTYKLRSHRRS